MNRATFITLNLRRKPTRTALTFVSLVIAFLLFMLLKAISTALTGGVTAGGVQRLIVDAKYSMTDNLPIAYIQTIRDLPHVVDVTQMVWFGGYYQDPKTAFTTLPVDQNRYFDVFPELQADPAAIARFKQSKRAVLVHESLATTHGWSVGQSIPMVGDIWPKEDGSWNWEFILAGTYRAGEKSRLPKAFLIRHDYFNESVSHWVKDQVGWAVVRLEANVDPATVIKSIDTLFENSSDPTKSITEDAYGQEMANEIGDIGLIASMILGAVFFTLILLTANVVSLSFRERIPELATMKSLGFRDNAISALVLIESVTLCLVGASVGVLAGFLVEPMVGASVEPVLGYFEMTWWHALQATAIGAVIGVLVGLLPAFKAKRLSITQALTGRQTNVSTNAICHLDEFSKHGYSAQFNASCGGRHRWCCGRLAGSVGHVFRLPRSVG